MPDTPQLADPDRDGSAAILLGMGFRAMTDRFHELLRAEGHEPLRPAHGFVFRLLASEGGLTATQLASRLSVSRQAAAKLTAELEEWGYLARGPHPTDRRAQVLSLTARGRRYVAHADELWARVEGEWAEVAGAAAVTAAKGALAAYVARAAGEEGRPALRPVW